MSSIVSKIAHDSHTLPPILDGRLPWWRALGEHFPSLHERFNLDGEDQLRVNGTALFDKAVVSAAATLVGATAIPNGFHPLRLRKQLAWKEFYGAFLNANDPNTFFVPPPAQITITRKEPKRAIFRPKKGTVVDLSFQSPFEPQHPAMRRDYLKHKANRTAHARYWRHGDYPRPTIIAIHGFGADPYWLNEMLFSIRWFYEACGVDVMLFTLPFHGSRQSFLSPYSGYGLFAGGLANLNEAFAQAVFDFRIFLNYLQHHIGTKKIGVTGISLGGYTTALLAALEPRLSFAVPHVPVASIADVSLEWKPMNYLLRSLMFINNQTIEDMRHYLAPVTPLTWKPILPTERLMIIGGVGDRLAPPKHSRVLWEHWNKCRIHWFPGSHLLHLKRNEFFEELTRFLHDIDFL